MEVKVRKDIEARRLELDGRIETERTDSRTIQTDHNNIQYIVDHTDVSVRGVTLHRKTSDGEASIIDDLLLDHSGRVNQKHAYFRNSAVSTAIELKSRKLFKVSEDQVVIYHDYVDVIAGEYDLVDEESFENALDELQTWAAETIEEYKRKLSWLEYYHDLDVEAEDFFERDDDYEIDLTGERE